jgi:hypothetical protein
VCAVDDTNKFRKPPSALDVKLKGGAGETAPCHEWHDGDDASAGSAGVVYRPGFVHGYQTRDISRLPDGKDIAEVELEHDGRGGSAVLRGDELDGEMPNLGPQRRSQHGKLGHSLRGLRFADVKLVHPAFVMRTASGKFWAFMPDMLAGWVVPGKILSVAVKEE